jgi:tRNA A37 threonylcarbamoyladenosine modification protein TsaB
VILIIDTSSSMAVVGTIGGPSPVFIPSRSPELITYLRQVARNHTLTGVAVATGPGSFTGLRKGVSFGLGLAMGLRIPIVPLPTLQLQAARSAQPVTAISDAGRGRYYYVVPGGEIALGEPAEIPISHQLVGWRVLTAEASFERAGHRFKPESELRSYADAAAELLKTAREVPYGSLKLEYMQSFAAGAR